MARRGVPGRPVRAAKSPETVDRILVGLCALIWLVLLGMSVAAGVALVDLGRGFHRPAHSPQTGLLYIVIGVSALIILVTIPVLLRARRATPVRTVAAPAPRPAYRTGHPRPENIVPERRDTVSSNWFGGGEVDRVLLRGTTELVGAIGVALIAVAVATYLMAVDRGTAAWVGYGVAGFIALTMPVVPWWHVRQLRTGSG